MSHWAGDAAMVIGVISGKWAVQVLCSLEEGPLRHNELHRAVGNGVHVTVLDSALRRLEAAGLVSRTTDPGTPPATWYELTSLSRTLLNRLAPLAQWAQEHHAELMALPGWPAIPGRSA
jgi:DNA-binding HxlR family transcriptional regulator